MSEVTPIGRREAGKEERRRQIIDAARALIRETGSTGLSMRELARRAGVSLATPYNLFGSKAAVVLAVLQDVRDYRQRFERLAAVDPFDRFFAAIALALEYYRDDPAFYRTLWREVFSASSDVRRAIYNPKRDAFWRSLMNDILAAGAIDPRLDADLLLHQLDHQFRSIMLDWVTDDLDADALEPAIVLGDALIFAGAATHEWRGVLMQRAIAAQARLQSTGIEASRLSVLPA